MDLEAELAELRLALVESQETTRRRIRRLSLTNVLLVAVVLAFGGAGAAYAVAAANSVNSASIIDGSIVTPDLKVGAISGSRLLDSGITSSKIYPNTLTGADINESTLTNVTPGDNSVTSSEVQDDSLTGDDINENTLDLTPGCPEDTTAIADLCFTAERPKPAGQQLATDSCTTLFGGMRLPSIPEANLMRRAGVEAVGWTDVIWKDGTSSLAWYHGESGYAVSDAATPRVYRCVTSIYWG